MNNVNNHISKDFDKNYADVTFVTMLFNIRDSSDSHANLYSEGEDRHLKRKYVNFYVKSLERLCAQFKNIVVFCDKECADNLYAPNATIVVMKLEELPLYQELNLIQQLFQRSAEEIRYTKNIHLNKKASMKEYFNRALYSVLVLSKQHIMVKAAELKSINTEYLCWIDAGLSNSEYKIYWDKWNGQISKLPENGKVRCLCSRNVSLDQTVIDIEKTSLKDAVYCRRARTISKRYMLSLIGCEIGNVPQIYGVSQIVHRADCADFEKRYNDYLKKVMDSGLICYEQGVLTLMLSEHPEWFDVVFTNETHMQLLFNGRITGE